MVKIMRLSCLLVFCCGLLVLSCGKQEQPELPAAEIVTNLKRDAAARAAAMRRGDYYGMVRYTPEKLANLAGGAEAHGGGDGVGDRRADRGLSG